MALAASALRHLPLGWSDLAMFDSILGKIRKYENGKLYVLTLEMGDEARFFFEAFSQIVSGRDPSNNQRRRRKV